MQVIQEDRKVWIGRPSYTENILKKFGMENCIPVATPFDLYRHGNDPHHQNDPRHRNDPQSPPK